MILEKTQEGFSLEPYNELYKIIVGNFGIDPNKKFETDGYYLTVADYMQGISDLGGHSRALALLKLYDQSNIELFLRKAIRRIIRETFMGNQNYAKYYKPIIKKAS